MRLITTNIKLKVEVHITEVDGRVRWDKQQDVADMILDHKDICAVQDGLMSGTWVIEIDNLDNIGMAMQHAQACILKGMRWTERHGGD